MKNQHRKLEDNNKNWKQIKQKQKYRREDRGNKPATAF